MVLENPIKSFFATLHNTRPSVVVERRWYWYTLRCDTIHGSTEWSALFILNISLSFVFEWTLRYRQRFGEQPRISRQIPEIFGVKLSSFVYGDDVLKTKIDCTSQLRIAYSLSSSSVILEQQFSEAPSNCSRNCISYRYGWQISKKRNNNCDIVWL